MGRQLLGEPGFDLVAVMRELAGIGRERQPLDSRSNVGGDVAIEIPKPEVESIRTVSQPEQLHERFEREILVPIRRLGLVAAPQRSSSSSVVVMPALCSVLA